MVKKSLTGESTSPVVKFRVDSDVKEILDSLKMDKANISEFIRNQIKNSQISHSSIDTEILKKIIPEFAKKGIKITLTEEEISRVKILAKEVIS